MERKFVDPKCWALDTVVLLEFNLVDYINILRLVLLRFAIDVWFVISVGFPT